MRNLYPTPTPRAFHLILATGVPRLLRGQRPAAGEEDREIPFGFQWVQPDPGGRFLSAERFLKSGAAGPNRYRATIGAVPFVEASAVWGA